MIASWKKLLSRSVTSYEQLLHCFPGQIDPAVSAVIARYPLRINPYYLDLIKKHGTPLLLQAVPSHQELDSGTCINDPLAEKTLSPTPGIVHKYPDRVLFLVSGQCAVYCRFCTRKRIVGLPAMSLTPDHIADAVDYIRSNPQIKDVLLSGGDPLLLDDDQIGNILHQLRAIRTVEIIRIGSRVPCTLPMRITTKLCRILKRYHPLFLNTHFNHPAELTAQAMKACQRLADAGIPLGCQTVLLKGVNDSAPVMTKLMRGLLRMRVKPYYLFQADLSAGTDHLRTTTGEGLAIMRQMIGHISGMAVPTYALDAPGGKGKVPLTPQYVTASGCDLIFTSYRGETCCYPEPPRDIHHFSG